MGKKLEMAIGALNGAIGDYLAQRGNGLATQLSFAHDHEPFDLADARALARAVPAPTPRVVVLLHGLMCTETIFQFEDGSDYGSLLARDLGFSPLYVRYNSGLSIAANGLALSGLLDRLVEAYPAPVEEILLLGYSMGGLVARSACHDASVRERSWLPHVKRAVYVGTPHRGAPMERGGRVLVRLLQRVPDPTTRLLAELGDLRSTGVKDLGDAVLRDEDRARHRPTYALNDPEHPVPLLPDIEHTLIAGAISAEPWITALFGDSIVPLHSATFDTVPRLGGIAPDHVRIVAGLSHVALAHHASVYAEIRLALETSSGSAEGSRR